MRCSFKNIIMADLHLDAKGSKVMESKTSNLEGLLQTPGEVLYLHLTPLMARRRP
jgi:C4-type Zn-finger protein